MSCDVRRSPYSGIQVALGGESVGRCVGWSWNGGRDESTTSLGHSSGM